MARGTTRAPSQHAYRGALGKTQTQMVHVSGPRGDLIAAQVHTTIDAVSDPELVERLYSEDPARALNVVRAEGGEAVRVTVPVVYHDPAAELMVLVLADGHRHAELDERIRLLTRFKADDAPIPPYAKEFAVVYGSAGLRAYLERKAADVLDQTRSAEAGRDIERRHADLERRQGELDRVRVESDKRAREIERRGNELEAAKSELERNRAELERNRAELERTRLEIERLKSEARNRIIEAAQAAPTRLTPAPEPAPLPPTTDSAVTPLPIASASSIALGSPMVSQMSGGVPDPTPLPAPLPGLHHDTHDRPKVTLDERPDQNYGATTVGPAPRNPDDVLTKPIVLSELDEIETSLQNVALASTEPLAGLVPNPARHESESGSGFESASTGITDVEEFREPAKKLNGHAVKAPNGAGAAAAAAGKSVPGEVQIEFDDETTGSAIVPQGSDPLTTETKELVLDVVTDAWLDKAAARDSSSVYADPHAGVRVALVAGEQLARGLGGALDVRVLLHRTRTYPLVTLVIGPPAAFRVPSTTQLAVIPLDIAVDQHRNALVALSRKFEATVDIVVRNRPIRRVRLTAPLADNVGYILRAADDHLRALTSASEGVPTFDGARDLVLGAGSDLLGMEHPDAGEFRDDKLAKLETAQHLRRAIAMARRFARPSREDYLVCTRGFPLPRWRELRRHVLESAVAWGLWMGPELAQVAVSEGLARSRRDLVVRLDAGFEKLKRHATAFDIDNDAAEDNYKALSEEARALGVELTRSGRGTFTSEEDSQVSGAIGGTPPKGVSKPRPTDELIAELDDREKRIPAAIALCDRGEAKAAAPVIASVSKMSRAEAVRVLGMSVKFGEAAMKPLMAGLQSSKGFLRHGCALALALLRTEEGTQAVIDLLLNEPTEIWREVARAIGQVGPTGLIPLASNFSRLGDRASQGHAERVAWAMAHIAVRGGKQAVETMAGGASVVAPVARHALELHGMAAKDQTSVRPNANGSQAGRDVTVNRAFSRRFFEALEQGLPEAGAQALEDLDASQPMELLDEADLIEDPDADTDVGDEAELDESDLIQT